MQYLGERVKKAVGKKEIIRQETADYSCSTDLLAPAASRLAKSAVASMDYVSQNYNYISTIYAANIDVIDETFILSLEELLTAKKYRAAISKTHELTFDHGDTSLPVLEKQLTGKLCAVLGIAYYHINDPISIKFLNSAIEILKGGDCYIYLSNTYNYLGLWKSREQKYKEMEYFLQEANSTLSNITLSNCHIKLDISYNLALSYYLQHRLNEALDSVNATLDHCSKYSVYCDYGKFKRLISSIYKSMGKVQDAVSSCLKAVDFYKLTDDDFMVHQCYVDLSVLYRILKDSHHSEHYINQAIRYFESINNSIPLANAFAEKIISMFVFNSNHTLIQDMIYATIKEPYLHEDAKGELLSILATIELRNKNYNKAFELYKLSEEHIAGNVMSEMDIFLYQGLSEIYNYYADSQKSNLYYTKATAVFESKPYYESLFNK